MTCCSIRRRRSCLWLRVASKKGACMSPVQGIDSSGQRKVQVSPWLTAAIPIENPYCSCKLTRGAAGPEGLAVARGICRASRCQGRSAGISSSQPSPPLHTHTHSHTLTHTNTHTHTLLRADRTLGLTRAWSTAVQVGDLNWQDPVETKKGPRQNDGLLELPPGWQVCRGLQLQSIWRIPTAALRLTRVRSRCRTSGWRKAGQATPVSRTTPRRTRCCWGT